jgi:dUTPase
MKWTATKHSIDAKAGGIDADYTGNIIVVLQSSGTTDYNAQIDDRITQICMRIATPG